MSAHRIKADVLAEKAKQYALLMRLDRPVGIYLLLWPTLWALWIASAGKPDFKVFIVFTLGVIIMRSAGCVINDYFDRDIDSHVERTQNRPLASGKVQPKETLLLFLALMAAALLLVLLLDAKTMGMAVVGAGLAMAYPLMKRLINIPQGFLGLAFGWSIPMAFVAQTGEVPAMAWLLYAATLFWVVAYDTMYALPDKEDDLKLGVKSSAIFFGKLDTVIIMALQSAFFIAMILLGQRIGMGPIYYSSLVLAALLVAYQQVLLKDREAKKCLQAFTNNQWFGGIVFAGLFFNYLLLS